MYGLSQPDIEWLKSQAVKAGISASEYLRRIVTADREKKSKERP
jgi:hypothetical protein